MFCSKCGTQLPEDSGFCHKCGAKVVRADTTQQGTNTSVATASPSATNTAASLPQPSPVPVQTVTPASIPSDSGNDFKTFVDNHVRTTTKFQSAEDLLKNSKPLMFLWFCFGIPTVIGLIAGGPLVALLLGLVFGHVARLVVGGIMRTKYTLQTIGNLDGNIDTVDLLQFLNEQLAYLHPYFQEWVQTSERGLVATLGASQSEVNIYTPFGDKQRSASIICIRPEGARVDTEKMEYVFGAMNFSPSSLSRVVGISIFSLLQIGDPKHICLFKTVPILQAAMKYYLISKGGTE